MCDAFYAAFAKLLLPLIYFVIFMGHSAVMIVVNAELLILVAVSLSFSFCLLLGCVAS